MLLALAATAPAQTHSWAASGSGDWNDAGNWSPSSVPNGAGDWASIAFDAVSAYTVTLDLNVTLDRLDLIGENAVLFASGRTLTIGTNVAIGVPMGANNSQRLDLYSSSVVGGGQFTNAATVIAAGNSAIEALYNDGLLEVQGNPTRGNATLTLTAPAYNQGDLDLTSMSGGYAATLRTDPGTQLENVGTLNFRTGSGGLRYFNGSLLNRSFVNVGQPTTLQTGPFIQDQNKFHVQAGGTVSVASGVTFQMDGGELELDSSFDQVSGVFDWNGGDITGPMVPELRSSTLEIDFNNLDNGTVRLLGNSFVDGIIRSGKSVELMGSAAAGNVTGNWVGTGDLVNQGGITLTSRDGGYSASMVIPGGARLVNQGTLESVPGTTGSRIVNGAVLNEVGGQIDVSTNTTFQNGPFENKADWLATNGATMTVASGRTVTQTSGTFDISDGGYYQTSGTLNLNGGSFVGVPRLGTMSVTTGAGFTSAFEGNILGNSSLTGNLQSGQTLNIIGSASFGNATLSLTQPTTSAGTLRLTSNDGGYAVTLHDGDHGLLNTGLLSSETGTNGARIINADLVNEGTVQISQPTTFISGSQLNRGSWNVDTGASILIGSSQTFTQESGTVQIDGTWEQTSGNAIFQGGAVTGTPLFTSTHTTFEAGFTTPFSGIHRGAATMTGNLVAGQSMTVRGDAGTGNATMDLAGGNVIDGEIDLTTNDGGYAVRVGTTDASLVNNGTIRSLEGASGARFLRGDVTNNGTLEVSYPLTLEDGPFINNGQISIDTDQTLTVANGMLFEQQGGTLDVNGTYYQQNGTTRFLGGDVLNTLTLGAILLELGPAFTGSLDAWVRGTSTLSGDLRPGQRLVAQGTATFGTANLGLAAASEIGGEVELTSIQGGYASSFGSNDIAMTILGGGKVWTTPGSAGARTLRGDITNGGTIQFDAATSFADGPVINNGDLLIASGIQATFGNGMTMEQSGGTLQVDGGLLIPSGTTRFLGGTVTGTPTLASGSVEFGPSFDSQLDALLYGTVTATGDLVEDQVLHVTGTPSYGTANLNFPAAQTSGGVIELSSMSGGYASALNITLGNELNNQGTIRTVVGAGGARTLNMQLDNDGLVDIQTRTALGRSGANHENRGDLQATAELVLTGSSFLNASGASFESNATVTNSQFPVTNAGTWEVGPGIGKMTVTGDWEQVVGGRLSVELGGLAAGTEHDQLVVNGTASLNGRIRLLAANGYTPKFGDQFVIVNANSTNFLGFDGLTYDGNLPLGLRFNLVDTGTQIIVQVVRTVRADSPSQIPFTASDPSPGLAGQVNTVQISGATAGGQVRLVYGTALGSTPTGQCSGVDYGIDSAVTIGTAFASTNGNALVSANVPSSASGLTTYFQALDFGRCELSNVVTFTFP